MKMIRAVHTVKTVKIVMANFAGDIFPICKSRCQDASVTSTVQAAGPFRKTKCTIEIGGRLRGDVINV